MHKAISFLNNKQVLIIIGLICALLMSAAAANYVLPSSSEITYKDNIGNSATFNPAEHSFIIHNYDGFTVSGTYTETSESYNCQYDQLGGETIMKIGNNKISNNGVTLTRV